MDTVIVTKKGGFQITYKGSFEFTGNYVILHNPNSDGTRTIHTVLDLTWIENIEIQKNSDKEINLLDVPVFNLTSTNV